MGFLIFAYRKLFLKRKIDDLNYRAMVLSQKKMAMMEQIGSVQQISSQSQEALSIWSSDRAMGIENQFKGLFQQYGQNNQNNNGMGIDSPVVMAYRAEQTRLANQVQQMKAGFDSKDQLQLKQLHAMDTAIDQEIALIDSQVKQLTPELENVEKAEDKAAKDEAPKFGVS